MQNRILRTLAYFEVFDFPLTLFEIYRHLESGDEVSFGDVKRTVSGLKQSKKIVQSRGYIARIGKENLCTQREKQRSFLRKYTKRALFVAKILRHIPYIRMIGLSGSLALKNVSQESDIDFFIVAKKGKIWFVRFWTNIVVILLGLHRGKNPSGKICLNHYISDFDLELHLQLHDRYTARLFSHLNILSGFSYYKKFIHNNLWISKWVQQFPRYSFPLFGGKFAPDRPSVMRKILEGFLDLTIGDSLEWLFKKIQIYKISKDNRRNDLRAVVVLSDDHLRFHLQAKAPWVEKQYLSIIQQGKIV